MDSDIIKAAELWCKWHKDSNFRCQTGSKTIADIFNLCKNSGVTSTHKPLYIRALAYMMLAWCYKANGDESEAQYCINVVENIHYSGFTLRKQTIESCKDEVREMKNNH